MKEWKGLELLPRVCVMGQLSNEWPQGSQWPWSQETRLHTSGEKWESRKELFLIRGRERWLYGKLIKSQRTGEKELSIGLRTTMKSSFGREVEQPSQEVEPMHTGNRQVRVWPSSHLLCWFLWGGRSGEGGVAVGGGWFVVWYRELNPGFQTF